MMKPPHTTTPAPIAFADALKFWFKLGLISFGGPAGQIAIMHQELVERRHWISERRFLHALNYCMLLPGPEAQQLATYLGWLMHRTWGGVIAGLLFILPSLVLLIALAAIYMLFGDTPALAAVLYGIKPAVTAIVIQAAHRIGSKTLKNPMFFTLALASFLAIFVLKIPFPLIVLAAALLGFLGQRMRPQDFNLVSAHSSNPQHRAPAIIGDDTPTPAHATFRWSRLSVVLAVGVGLWLIPMGVLTALLGWQHTLTQMSWFFTTAALMTFGGAYAVLPYVYQGAVEHYGWLSPRQMMDGLALGESTPGPLIMVVAFVAFVGGYQHAALGADALLMGGVVAACLVTWFTFLPSFIFILAGAPLVESTHGNLNFTAPLTAITAAVVGVIVNLALFFAYHTWWPQGISAPVDLIAVGLTGLALLALFYFKRSVMEVLAGSALLGGAFYLF
jgi:chromate transporter